MGKVTKKGLPTTKTFLIKDEENVAILTGQVGSLKISFTYISTNNAWMIESLFGVKISYIFLNDELVEDLFKNANFCFYQNSEKTHLFSTHSDLLEHDFGSLSPISAFDALKFYGIENLEKAKEKLYIRVK